MRNRGNLKGVKLRTFCAISAINNRKYLPQLSAANCNIYKCICCMNASEKIRERERGRAIGRAIRAQKLNKQTWGTRIKSNLECRLPQLWMNTIVTQYTYILVQCMGTINAQCEICHNICHSIFMCLTFFQCGKVNKIKSIGYWTKRQSQTNRKAAQIQIQIQNRDTHTDTDTDT